MVKSFSVGVLVVALVASKCLAAPQKLDGNVQFNIPQQRADKALSLYADQADITLIFPFNVARQFSANPVSGEMTIADAATALLEGTPLNPVYIADGRLKIEVSRDLPVEEKKTVKKHKLSAIAAFLSTLFIAPNVTAQMSDDGSIVEVVVKGQKLSRLKAIDIKRNANTVMDALSTDNLGRLPDKNAAESLNRLPGVSVIIEKGEGRFASIRGIRPDWNRVTINGFETGSPEKDGSGRAMPLDVLGGEMLQTIEVFKAKTADMDGEGIGGTVNIVTKKPLSGEDFSATANVRVGMEESDQENPYYDEANPYNVDLALSGKLSESVGWMVGGSYTHREYLAQGIYQDDWREVEGVAFPNQTKNNYYVLGRERQTAIGGLEFNISDSTNLLAQAFFSKFEEFQHRNRFRQYIGQDISAISSTSGDTVYLEPDATSVGADLRLEETNKELFNVSVSGETLVQQWTFQYGINYGENEVTQPNAYWKLRQASGVELGPDSFSLFGNGVVDLREGGLAHNDAANLRFHSVGYQADKATQDITSAKFDASYDYYLGSYASTVKFGVKYSHSKKDFDFNNNVYSIQRDIVDSYGVTDGGFANDVDGQPRSNIWLNLNALNGLFDSRPELFSASGDNLEDNLANDRVVKEDIFALYAMNSTYIGDLQLIAGVRFEKTDIDSTANQQSADQYSSVSISGSSDVVLPSLIANYSVLEDLMLRASYTTSLGRPDYGDLSASSSLGTNNNGDTVLSIGNPDLDPYTADNYDIALEWYPMDTSVISVAWFRKKIHDIIINDEQRIAGGEYQGVNYGVDELFVETVRNADTATVDGYEFNIQHQFEGLPAPFNGVGVSYSYTSIDAEFFDSTIDQSRTLEDQPETIQSFTFFYENYGFYAGFTYNYNDYFLTDSNNLNDTSDDIYQGEFGRWDFRASYAINEKLVAYVDVNNLNNEPTTEFQAGKTAWNTEYEYVGSTYYAGITYQF